MMGITPTHLMPMSMCHTHMGYPPIHIGTYTYVCPGTYTVRGYPPPHGVPTRTYHYAYTPVYMQVPVLPTHVKGLVRGGVLRGGTYAVVRCGFGLRLSRVASPHPSPVLDPETMTALMLRYVERQEEVAYQYALALVRRLTADLSVHDALRLARDIVTETTNDIGDFEGRRRRAESTSLCGG